MINLENVLIPYFVTSENELHFYFDVKFVSFPALVARFMNFQCQLHPRRH